MLGVAGSTALPRNIQLDVELAGHAVNRTRTNGRRVDNRPVTRSSSVPAARQAALLGSAGWCVFKIKVSRT